MRERFKESKKKKTSFLATFGAEGYATLAWDQAPHLVGEGGGKRGSGGGGGLETRLWCHRSALQQMNLSLKCHVKFSSRMSAWAHYFAFVKKNIWIRDEVLKSASKEIYFNNLDHQLE